MERAEDEHATSAIYEKPVALVREQYRRYRHTSWFREFAMRHFCFRWYDDPDNVMSWPATEHDARVETVARFLASAAEQRQIGLASIPARARPPVAGPSSARPRAPASPPTRVRAAAPPPARVRATAPPARPRRRDKNLPEPIQLPPPFFPRMSPSHPFLTQSLRPSPPAAGPSTRPSTAATKSGPRRPPPPPIDSDEDPAPAAPQQRAQEETRVRPAVPVDSDDDVVIPDASPKPRTPSPPSQAAAKARTPPSPEQRRPSKRAKKTVARTRKPKLAEFFYDHNEHRIPKLSRSAKAEQNEDPEGKPVYCRILRVPKMVRYAFFRDFLRY